MQADTRRYVGIYACTRAHTEIYRSTYACTHACAGACIYACTQACTQAERERREGHPDVGGLLVCCVS